MIRSRPAVVLWEICMTIRSAASLLLLPILLASALSGTEVMAMDGGGASGSGAAEVSNRLWPNLPRLSGTLFQDGEGEFTTGETGGSGDDASASDLLPKFSDMIDTVNRDVHEGLVEFWVGAYMWIKPYIIAYGKASQQDMRTAQSQGVLASVHGVGIETVNFKDELNVDDKPEGMYEQMQVELGVRFENNVFRLLWWLWEDNQDDGDWLLVKKTRAFGDKVYYAGKPIRFPFRMMDTKLIYEYRIIPWNRLQVFFGIALHWIYTIDYNSMFYAYPELGYEHSSAGVHDIDNPPAWNAGDAYFVDEPIDEDPKDGHYPLASLSLRVDARPFGGWHIAADVQEMYVYYGNYIDLRAGVWNEIALGVKIGVGYRLWAITADITEVGGQKTNFTGRAVFQGFWAGLFVHF